MIAGAGAGRTVGGIGAVRLRPGDEIREAVAVDLRADGADPDDVPAAFLQPLLLDITNQNSVARAVEVKAFGT